MRVQVDERPRIESTSTSSTASCAGGLGMPRLPALEARERGLLVGEFATTSSGIFARGGFFGAARFARDGATRGASPSILRKCGGHGASPRPAASSRAASSSSASSEPGGGVHAGVRIADRRRSAAGTVSTVKSAGSQSGTSSHASGVDTRASGSGRTE